MADNKTQPTNVTPEEFLATVADDRRRAEGERMLAVMRDVTGDPGTMWGPSIVGFGERHYRYASGREGDWMRVGFSPRKAKFALYGLKDFPEQQGLIERLGHHSEGAGCVYARRIEDLDEPTLRELIALAYARGDVVAES